MDQPIFLIDDNELDNFINRSVLMQAKYQGNIINFSEAETALEDLRKIKNNSENIPGIIFLDINMPLMDGFMFLKKFDALPGFIKDKTKIVMLSSSTDQRDAEKAKLSPYVVDYINKPLTGDKLKSILN